jgi:hypothetical protein
MWIVSPLRRRIIPSRFEQFLIQKLESCVASTSHDALFMVHATTCVSTLADFIQAFNVHILLGHPMDEIFWMRDRIDRIAHQEHLQPAKFERVSTNFAVFVLVTSELHSADTPAYNQHFFRHNQFVATASR